MLADAAGATAATAWGGAKVSVDDSAGGASCASVAPARWEWRGADRSSVPPQGLVSVVGVVGVVEACNAASSLTMSASRVS